MVLVVVFNRSVFKRASITLTIRKKAYVVSKFTSHMMCVRVLYGVEARLKI